MLEYGSYICFSQCKVSDNVAHADLFPSFLPTMISLLFQLKNIKIEVPAVLMLEIIFPHEPTVLLIRGESQKVHKRFLRATQTK